MSYRSVLAMLFVSLLILGCGQKGDLYRTENVPPPTMQEEQKDKKEKED